MRILSFGGSYRFITDPLSQDFVRSYIEEEYIDGGFRIVKLSKKK